MATILSDRRNDSMRRMLGSRRRYPRVRMTFDGFCESSKRMLMVSCGDLSLRGVFLPTSVPDSLGSRTVLRIRLPGSRTMLKLNGRVAWSNEEHGNGPLGMGLKFDGADLWQLKRIAASMLRRVGRQAFPSLLLDRC